MNDKARELMRQARERSGLKQKEIAKEMKITNQAVSYWEQGKNSISIDDFVKYCQLCGADFIKILSEAYGDPVANLQSINCTADEAEMVRKYRCLDRRGQRTVMRILNAEYEDVSKNSVEDLSSAAGVG